jgi:uncharacterized protein (TIGR02145 family)
LVAENCGGKVEFPFTFSSGSCTKPTASIISVTQKTGSSVTVAGEVNASGFTTTVMVDYGKTSNYGSSVYMTPSTVTGSTNTSVSATITGLDLGTLYYFRISAENCGGETNTTYKTYTTPTTDEFPDTRDGKKYIRVKSGNQIWMADNLAYLPYVNDPQIINSDAKPYYYVYGYTGTSVSAAKATTNYTNYGVLYNWYAARTGCPSGWHLPTDDEWKTLEQYVGMSPSLLDYVGYRGTNEGYKLKAASGWNSGGNGSDTYKFTALPGGMRTYIIFFKVYFLNVGNIGYWWTSSQTSGQSWYRQIEYNRSDIYRSSHSSLHLGYSVRCVQNQ